MVKRKHTEKQRAIWRKQHRRRKDRLHTPKEIAFKASLARGAPVHQAVGVAFPEIKSAKKAGEKLEELKRNPLLSNDIKVSQVEYTRKLQEKIGEHPLDFIAEEEVNIVKAFKVAPIRHRAKAQPTLDSMKRSIGLDKADTGGKHLHLHLSTIKSEEERKDLLRILGGQKIDNESPDTEGQSEPKD